jgi:hypothetical protein
MQAQGKKKNNKSQIDARWYQIKTGDHLIHGRG